MFESGSGFLGTQASLLTDITLVIQVVFFFVLCLGVVAQLLKRHKLHDRLMIPVVALNFVFIGFVMLPSFVGVSRGDSTELPVSIAWIHAILGSIAQGLATYCWLAGVKILPRRIGRLRYWMWVTFFFWGATVAFGIATYVLWYVPTPTTTEYQTELRSEHDEALVSDDLLSEHSADLTAEVVDDHAEPLIDAVDLAATISGEWTQLTTTNAGPGARYGQAMAYHSASNRLIVYGGQAAGNTYNDVWQLNLANLTWQEIVPTTEVRPTLRQDTIIMVDESATYLTIATGKTVDGAALNDVWRFNLLTGVWEEPSTASADLPPPRYSGGGTSIDGHLVMTHGIGAQRLDDTWRFNQQTVEWEPFTAAEARPVGRCLFPTAAYQGDLVLHGGCALPLDSCFLDDTWLYDVATGQWRELVTDLKPMGRHYHTIVTTDAGQLILFGGLDSSETPRHDTWLLDLEASTWYVVETAEGPSARYQHTAVWTGETMLLYGGQGEAGVSAELWSLRVE